MLNGPLIMNNVPMLLVYRWKNFFKITENTMIYLLLIAVKQIQKYDEYVEASQSCVGIFFLRYYQLILSLKDVESTLFSTSKFGLSLIYFIAFLSMYVLIVHCEPVKTDLLFELGVKGAFSRHVYEVKVLKCSKYDFTILSVFVHFCTYFFENIQLQTI